MGTYKTSWDCCDSITTTEGWIPQECPFCRPHRISKKALARVLPNGLDSSYTPEIFLKTLELFEIETLEDL